MPPSKHSSPANLQVKAASVDASELVARIQTNDQQAEAELVERFRRGVTFIVRRLVRVPDEVEDLFQETFHIALIKIRRGDLREPARLPGFITGVARNLAREHLRQRIRRQDHEVPETSEGGPETGVGQLERLLRREKARTVRWVISELRNERDRQLLYRFYIAEESKDEICQDLGLSSLHFNRVLHRARQRYLTLWQERAVGAPPLDRDA